MKAASCLTSATRGKKDLRCVKADLFWDDNTGLLDLGAFLLFVKNNKWLQECLCRELKPTHDNVLADSPEDNLDHVIAVLMGLSIKSNFISEDAEEELLKRYDSLMTQTDPMPWGDATDTAQTTSTRAFEFTAKGKQALDRNDIVLWSVLHKLDQTHEAFHKQALNSSSKKGVVLDEPVLSSVLAAMAPVVNVDPTELCAIQWNLVRGPLAKHQDEPGDIAPLDGEYIAGGGGFGHTVANISLKSGAMVFLYINGPQTNNTLFTLAFTVSRRSMWAIQGAALWGASHAVLPDVLPADQCRGSSCLDLPYRVSMNLRYGRLSNDHCHWYYDDSNFGFKTNWRNCYDCGPSKPCVKTHSLSSSCKCYRSLQEAIGIQPEAQEDYRTVYDPLLEHMFASLPFYFQCQKCNRYIKTSLKPGHDKHDCDGFYRAQSVTEHEQDED